MTERTQITQLVISATNPPPQQHKFLLKNGFCWVSAAFLALFFVFGLGLLTLRGQVVIPTDVYQWDGGAGTSYWDDEDNWAHPTDDDSWPPEDAAALFGAVSGATADERLTIEIPDKTEVGSLWFDHSEEGPGYTLLGEDLLTLGAGVANEGHLIAVAGSQWSRETRIIAPYIERHDSAGGTLRISNESYAGLLIAGGSGDFDGTLDLSGRRLQIRGGGITHIASTLLTNQRIDVQGHRTQLVLSGEIPWWSGAADLEISNLGAVVLKSSDTLSTSNIVRVREDGTLMLRAERRLDPNQPWNPPSGGITVNAATMSVSAGLGAARRTDLITGAAADFVGTIYNDGGDNAINSNIRGESFSGPGSAGDVYFNSREGNLTLAGRVYLGLAQNFVKDGRGTITLSNDKNPRNTWQETKILAGELRIERSHYALAGGFEAGVADAPALQFAGRDTSAVLGLGVDTDFTRQIGTGASSVYWTGHGGFVARGEVEERTVSLTNADSILGGLLHWHRGGFMGDMDDAPNAGGYQLLLGSEVNQWGGMGLLFWENAIDLGNYAQFQSELEAANPEATYSRERTVNVLDGWAEMRGKLSGTGFDFAKRGKGVLSLTSDESDYSAQENGNVASTKIYEGALQGNAANLDFTNIVLAGGVYMPNVANLPSEVEGDPGDPWAPMLYTFDLTLGTGAGQFRWDAESGGGFAAGVLWDQNTRIRIGDPTAALTWGDQYFVASGQELILGHYLSQSQLIWDKALNLGADSQTIRVQGHPQNTWQLNARITQNISGSVDAALNIVGRGWLTLEKQNALSRLNISGATVSLQEEGTLIDTHIYVSNGSKLEIHDSAGTSSRLGTGGLIDLSGGGILAYQGGWGNGPPDVVPDAPGFAPLNTPLGILSEDGLDTVAFGKLRLSGGAAEIEITGSGSVLHFSELERTHERTTLNLRSGGFDNVAAAGIPLIKFTAANVDYAEFEDFFPWATINEVSWAVADGSTGIWREMAPDAYTTTPPDTWTASSHVVVLPDWSVSDPPPILLDQSRTIRSLMAQHSLDLQGHTLTLGSGGVIMNGGYWSGVASSSISGGAGAALTTGGAAVPFYIHTRDYGEIGVALTGGMDLVKAGIGTLSLTGNGAHQVGAVYIHDGRLELNLGAGGSFNTTGAITVGDGARTDVLRLPKYDNQITGSRHVILKGSDYGEGILEFAFNSDLPSTALSPTTFAGTSHQLAKLEVQGHGVIDFVGGEAGAANFLYLDELVIDFGSRLSIRNWFEGEDYLLVRNTDANRAYVEGILLKAGEQRIVFEDYGPLYTSHYNYDYFAITPFNHNDCPECPEPSTYGAILGALGVAVVVWRKRGRKKDNAGRGPNEGLAQ